MRRVLIVDAVEHQLPSIEGRLRRMDGIAGLERAGRGGRLALLVDVPDREAFRRLVENRVALLTGVQDCRPVETPDAGLTARLAETIG